MNKIFMTTLAAAGLLALLIAGCSVDQPAHPQRTVAQPTGAAALTNYIALGNSLTAGFMDGGLHMNGQLNSYPALIATRMGLDIMPGATATFTQPWIAEPGIGSSDTEDDMLVASTLYWNGGTIAFDSYSIANVPAMLLGSALPVPYNNLGVPGATLNDVANALDSASSQSGDNSFFDFILRNPTFGNVSMLGQCVGRGPTLVTLWIGNNDVLGGATDGDPVEGVNVTPAAAFGPLYEGLVTSIETMIMDETGYMPTIVVANLPSITSIPYFIPKAVFDGITMDLVGFTIPTAETDVQYVRFPALSEIQEPGFTPPLASEFTLDATETSLITDNTTAFNGHIETTAAAHGLEVVDMAAILAGLNPLTERNHFLFLVQGGLDVATASQTTLFSLDGIHPNAAGYVLAANAFIDGINAALGLAGAQALTDVPGVVIPWDPTYGRMPAVTAEDPGSIVPSARTAAAMDAVFR